MRLLLIEDDDILGEGLRDYLRAEGHVVDWCSRLRDAAAWRGEPYDAWLVDWQLPDGSGLDWLRGQRARGDTTPALMLTARDRLADRVLGLDAGADDYLVKPFAPEELVARLRARVPARRQAAAAARRASATSRSTWRRAAPARDGERVRPHRARMGRCWRRWCCAPGASCPSPISSAWCSASTPRWPAMRSRCMSPACGASWAAS